MFQQVAFAQSQCADRTARSWFSNACARVAQKLPAEARCYVRTEGHGVDARVIFSGQDAPQGHWKMGCILRGSFSEARAYYLILRALERVF